MYGGFPAQNTLRTPYIQVYVFLASPKKELTSENNLKKM
jgi:hypothetical protein